MFDPNDKFHQLQKDFIKVKSWTEFKNIIVQHYQAYAGTQAKADKQGTKMELEEETKATTSLERQDLGTNKQIPQPVAPPRLTILLPITIPSSGKSRLGSHLTELGQQLGADVHVLSTDQIRAQCAKNLQASDESKPLTSSKLFSLTMDQVKAEFSAQLKNYFLQLS